MFRRFCIYILIGAFFGVFDFYYQAYITNNLNLLALSSSGKQIAWLALVLGVWLVPVIPIIVDAAKASQSKVVAALASVLTWCAAVVAYYLTNGVQLAFIEFPGRPELHISNRAAPFFWANWRSIVLYDLIGGSLEWLVVAVICGTLIGFLVSYFYLRLRKTRQIS